ncbi:MAG: hypothetical protein ACT4PP_15840 [Sporichthyaceae bacterium]
MSESSPPPPEGERYRTEQFTFVDAPDDLSAGTEATHWLAFMNSRAGRRLDRRERARERGVLIGVGMVAAALVAALLVWAPWQKQDAPDTGAQFLGGDRVALLMQIQGPTSEAVATAILVYDRASQAPQGVTVVPGRMVLDVQGQGRLTVNAALAAAGPTLSREAIGELVGVPLVGTWLLTEGEYSALVDQVGSLRRPLRELGPGSQAEAVHALVAAFPPVYSVTRDLLLDFGILAAPGLEVERLAAVLTGLAARGGAFGQGELPVDAATGGLDLSAARSGELERLGARPGEARVDSTPRVLVSIARGGAVRESDVRADVLNAGYEYRAGPPAPADAETSIMVRASVPGALDLGKAVAAALGLDPRRVVSAAEVPATVDVVVVIARAVRARPAR